MKTGKLLPIYANRGSKNLIMQLIWQDVLVRRSLLEMDSLSFICSTGLGAQPAGDTSEYQ